MMRIALGLFILIGLNFCTSSREYNPAYVNLAKKIEQDARSQSAVAITAVHDADAFCSRVRGKAGKDKDKEFYNEFARGYKETAKPGEQFCMLAKQGSLTFLRMQGDEREQRALFRNIGSGVSYIELLFATDAEGKARVIDLFSFTTGEYQSESCRVLYRLGLRNANPNVFEEVLNESKDFMDSMQKYEKMSIEAQKKNHQAVLDIYNSIPKAHRSKPLMMLRLAAAQNVSKPLWMESIKDYAEAFPNDPSVSFLKLDAFLLQGNFDAALGCVTDLDKAVGGDDYLNSLRAQINHMAGRKTEAVVLARKAAEALPDMLQTQATYLDCLVGQKEYVAAIKTLDGFAKKFGWNDAPLATNPLYAEFLKSKEYLEWKAKRAAK